MIFHHYVVTKCFWYFPLILQGAIAVVMIERKLVKIFPLFFSYTLGVLCTDVPLTFLPYGHKAYSLVYWSGEALAIALGIAVIFEVLRHIFSSSSSGQSVLNAVWILAVIAALSAVVMLIWNKPGVETDWLLEVIVLAERSLRFLQASLLIVVIALMSVLGLTWHNESLGILAGFGVYSALALVVYEFGYHLHLMSPSAYLLLNSAAYNVAVLIWAFYMLRSRRRPPINSLPGSDLTDWNYALSSYIHDHAPRR